MSKISRRTFLKSSGFAGSVMGLTASQYRSAFSAELPSERIRVGMIGVGNQGGPKNNLKHFVNNTVAVCDLDQNYLGEAATFVKEKTQRSPMMSDDYRRLLDSRDIDAVVITVPDHWHALMTIDACKAGKDVYCEKPLTLVISEGKPMIEAARKYQRVVQTGSMQRSGDEFKLAVDLVQSGLLGTVTQVDVNLPGPNWISRAGKPVPDSEPPQGFDFNRWLGPAPLRSYNKNRCHYLFRFFWDYSGGQQTNFGAHHLDIAQWGLGMDDSGPISVEGTAVYNANGWYETPDSTVINYVYSNGVTLRCRQKSETKDTKQGTEFIGDKGRLLVYRGGIEATPKELLKGVDIPDIAKSQMSPKHVQNFMDCVKSRKAPVADVAIGHRSATVCHLGNIAVRTKKKIAWDPKTETVVGDAEAAKWTTKEYRKPWSLS